MPTTGPILVRRAVEEIWNCQQLAVADELFAPDYVNHGGLITDLVRGPEAIKTSVVLLRRAFPRLHVTIDDLTAADELTVLTWHAHNHMPPTKRDAEAALQGDGLTGVTSVREIDGQIQESWTAWDQAEALRWVGLREDPDHERVERDTATDCWDNEGGALPRSHRAASERPDAAEGTPSLRRPEHV